VGFRIQPRCPGASCSLITTTAAPAARGRRSRHAWKPRPCTPAPRLLQVASVSCPSPRLVPRQEMMDEKWRLSDDRRPVGLPHAIYEEHLLLGCGTFPDYHRASPSPSNSRTAACALGGSFPKQEHDRARRWRRFVMRFRRSNLVDVNHCQRRQAFRTLWLGCRQLRPSSSMTAWLAISRITSRTRDWPYRCMQSNRPLRSADRCCPLSEKQQFLALLCPFWEKALTAKSGTLAPRSQLSFVRPIPSMLLYPLPVY
jgi:hypothetical protein